MESRKTTTITFRIDDSLKQKLSQVAERENKTITIKAKEALTEYLEVNPARGFIREVNSEIQKINIDVENKLRNWKGAFDKEYIDIVTNQKLLNHYHTMIKELIKDFEKEKASNSGMGFKLTYFAIAIIFFNFMLTGLLFVVLVN